MDNPTYLFLGVCFLILSLRKPFVVRLADAQDEIVRLRAKSNLVDDLERQIRQLKNELYIATSKPSYLER